MLTKLVYSASAKQNEIARVAQKYGVCTHIVEHGVKIFAHKGFDAALNTVERQIAIDAALRTGTRK